MADKASIDIADLGFSEEKIKEISDTLVKIVSASTITHKGFLEMATMTRKLNETQLTGKIKGDFIVLDTQFNEAKTWKLDPKFRAKFVQGETIVVIFQDNKIVDIKQHFENTIDTPKSNEPRKKLIPKHGFYVTELQEKILNIAAKAFHDETNPFKGFSIGLEGQAGYGKTSIAEHFAHINQLPLLTINCPTIPDNENWFVIPEFKNHETQFTPTKFTDFLRMGNCVILFDEINRIPAWVSNALLPILDHQRFTSVRNVDIALQNKIAFFFTSNKGAEYAGTNPVDKALRRRMLGVLKVGALPELVETELLETRIGLDYDIAKNIVRVFSSLRESELKQYPVNVSTATSLNVAWWIKYGATIREAFEVVIMNDAPEEAHKIILDRLNTNGYY